MTSNKTLWVSSATQNYFDLDQISNIYPKLNFVSRIILAGNF